MIWASWPAAGSPTTSEPHQNVSILECTAHYRKETEFSAYYGRLVRIGLRLGRIMGLHRLKLDRIKRAKNPEKNLSAELLPCTPCAACQQRTARLWYDDCVADMIKRMISVDVTSDSLNANDCNNSITSYITVTLECNLSSTSERRPVRPDCLSGKTLYPFPYVQDLGTTAGFR